MTATVGRADDARPRDPATAPARSSLQYLNFSDGAAAADGPWASGPSFDGKGEYSYHDGPTSSVPMPPPTHPDVRFYGTTELPNVVEKTAGIVQDTLNKE